MSLPNCILLVPHTHWDREWYLTQEQFRVRLVALLDLVLDVLERDPAFRHFMLDGQTIVLDDYLAVRPEARVRIERLVRAGRLLIGPWFVLPDEWLVSGEALIRNLRRGLRDAEAFGGAMRIGYVPDQFGHVGQLPQIFRGFGFEGAALWRGVPGEILDSVFDWESPDGSRIDTLYFPAGYGHAAHLPLEPGALAARLKREVAKQLPFAKERPVVLMNGVDHMLPQVGLPAALEAARAHLSNVPIEFSTLPAVLDRFSRESGQPHPVHRGELRSGLRTPLLPGCASTRITQKQRDIRNETRLVRVLEPLSAWLAARGGRADHGLIDLAWRHALENHPHDSICGCSIDRVHAQMESRFDRVEEITEAEIVRVARELTADLPVPPGAGIRGAADAVVAWNPHAGGASEIDSEIETSLPLPPRTGACASAHLRDAEGHRIPADLDVMEPGFTWENTAPVALARALVPDLGREVAGYFIDELVWRREGTTLVVEARLDGMPHRVFDFEAKRNGVVAALADPELTHATIRAQRSSRVRVRAVAVLPGHGLRVFRLHAGRGGARAAAELAVAPGGGRSEDGVYAIENALWRVEVNRAGQFDLLHRERGERIVDALRFASEGDRGDSYNFDRVPDGEIVKRLEAVRVSMRSTEAAAELIVRARLRVPVALAADRARRSPRRLSLPVTLRVRLPHGLDRVDIDASVDNRARDHRLRLHVRAPWRARRLRVASAFEFVERPIEPAADAFGSRFTSELPSGAGPQRHCAVLDDGDRAMTLANRGAPEVEAVHESDGSTALAVTMLRAVGWLSRADLVSRPLPAGPVFETPGAQAEGRHAISLSLRLHEVDSPLAAGEAERFAAPPCVLPHGAAAALPSEIPSRSLSPGESSFADGSRLIEVADPQVLVSAIEPQAPRVASVRLWNSSALRRTVQVRWLATGACRLELAGLAGDRVVGSATECTADGSVRLDLRPWQIVTLHAETR